MKDITGNYGPLYHPKSALVFYETKGRNSHTYVEHFEMDKNGHPTNAHPLTVREAKMLSQALGTDEEKDSAFLKPEGIIPINVLFLNPSESGSLVWFTKSQKIKLHFVDSLGIPSGEARVPAMLWHANKNSLSVFALASDRRPDEKTTLYHAPFFNVYENGAVCMGTVDVSIKHSASKEKFMAAWEDYFFNSYFSHLMQGHNPINGNCLSIWKELVDTGKPFPKEVLKKTNKTIKNLLQ